MERLVVLMSLDNEMKRHLFNPLLVSLLVSIIYYTFSYIGGSSYKYVFTILLFLSFLSFGFISPRRNYLLGFKAVGTIRIAMCVAGAVVISLVISGISIQAVLNLAPFCLFYMTIIMINDKIFYRQKVK